MADDIGSGGFEFTSHAPDPAHAYLWPAVLREIERLSPRPDRVFDLGCGNGAFAQRLAEHGYDVVGVDPSETGLAIAQARYPTLPLFQGDGYTDLGARFGSFPVVVCLEVIEHVYAPRRLGATLFDLVEPGGTAIVSTPYHGYVKNLALALSGKLDQHFTALWDHGHIKFWSIKTLSVLIEEAGFETPRFLRVGRVPPLAKSMIAVARRPRAATAPRRVADASAD